MRKSFGWALLCTALLSWNGTSQAEIFDEPAAEEQVDVSISDDVGNDCLNCCDCGSWLDGTYVWLGADVYKSIGDRLTNINGGTGALTQSPGVVTGINTSFGLTDSKIRGQLGASYGAYDPRGRLGIVPAQNTIEEQVYITGGFYKRSDMCNDCDPLSFAVVYDLFFADQWGINANRFDLSQARGIVGYALNPCTEVGVWGTISLDEEDAAVTVAGAPGVRRQIRAMDQFNGYVKQHFEFGGELMFYAGVVDNADIGDWQFGLLGTAPLNCHWSLYSNFTYAAPAARSGPNGSGEEQYNFAIGLAYYFGGNGATGCQNLLPLLNVANNGSFLITD